MWTGEKVREILAMLADHQGAYGRMLAQGDAEQIWDQFAEALNIKGVDVNVLELILFIEG